MHQDHHNKIKQIEKATAFIQNSKLTERKKSLKIISSRKMLVNIGGINQVLYLRGFNLNNPLVLWLHGGPGMPQPAFNYIYQDLLLDNFNFCYWIQRGSGLTYYVNNKKAPELTIDRLIADLGEIIQFLKKYYHCEQVILVGHSFGSLLGALYAKAYPDDIIAYMGVSQIVDMIESKELILKQAKEIAEQNADSKGKSAIHYNLSQVEQAHSTRYVPAKHYMTAEKIASQYLASSPIRTLIKIIGRFLSSPDLELADWRWLTKMIDFEHFINLQGPLMVAAHRLYLREDDQFQIPVCFLSSEGDFNAPYQQVLTYYQKIKAPLKQFTLLSGVAHSPFIAYPEQFTHFFQNWTKDLSSHGLLQLSKS